MRQHPQITGERLANGRYMRRCLREMTHRFPKLIQAVCIRSSVTRLDQFLDSLRHLTKCLVVNQMVRGRDSRHFAIH